jgi:hypothetical protein
MTPGAHPYAVLSYDYWTRRFGRDPKVVGRSVRIGGVPYEIVGVVGAGFTGTEPGTFIDIFVPNMMQPAVDRYDSSWFRPYAIMRPGAALEPVRAKLQVILSAFQEERAKGWTGQSKQFLDRFLNQTLLLQPAPSGVSGTQGNYRRSLIVLGVLVALVLLIASANVANLMTCPGGVAGRVKWRCGFRSARGRWRLIQMVLVESAWVGFLARWPADCSRCGPRRTWLAESIRRTTRRGSPFRRTGASSDSGSLSPAEYTFLFGLAPALRASFNQAG